MIAEGSGALGSAMESDEMAAKGRFRDMQAG